jgi:hypothetical protein
MAAVDNARLTEKAPEGAWMDPVVRRLRTNRVLVPIYLWLSRTLVPALFAIFIALPIGALVIVVFIPKFVRNWQRRIKYQARPVKTHVDRDEPEHLPRAEPV